MSPSKLPIATSKSVYAQQAYSKHLAKVSRPCTKLEGLAIELLREIYSHLTTKKDLWSLSLASKRIHKTVEEYLYREFFYEHEYYCVDEEPACRQPCLLLRTLKKFPDRAKYVKDIRVGIKAPLHCNFKNAMSWKSRLRFLQMKLPQSKKLNPSSTSTITQFSRKITEKKGAGYPDWSHTGLSCHDLDTEVAVLMFLAPNLESLGLELHEYDYYAHGFKTLGLLRYPEDCNHGLKHLKHLSLQFGEEDKSGRCHTQTFISPILTIPTLKSLELKYLNMQYNGETKWKCPLRSSSVTSLTIENPMDSEAGWKILLDSFAALETVDVEFNSEWEPGDSVDHFISFIDALSIHRHTLQKLYIDGYVGIAPPDRYPKPTLREFNKLSKLRLDSWTLWMDKWMVTHGPDSQFETSAAIHSTPA